MMIWRRDEKIFFSYKPVNLTWILFHILVVVGAIGMVVDCAVSLTPCLLVYQPISFLHWLLFQWFVKEYNIDYNYKKVYRFLYKFTFSRFMCAVYQLPTQFFASSQKHFCVKQNRQKPIEIMYNKKAHLTFTTWLLWEMGEKCGEYTKMYLSLHVIQLIALYILYDECCLSLNNKNSIFFSIFTEKSLFHFAPKHVQL